ncbi:Mrp family chromosome partitioning ATPase [Isoptericola jiangsuensis]|uniref:Mrp family chromosome partitioning ATPase n=1 Tax=Isoptericola jiangsuensis TaxID=548579 RepID=A0A2A9F0D0_9MICO|nr:polysaccharide biosynthesis tyrosine autokinase [Isoptericola jiangsuensis]PFG44231.1 Mrp family chromosome partitioning ATPase [Isoptericola jiangsuensis]
MTLREFLRVVWASKWFVLGAVVLVVGAGYVYADRQEITYQATATVELASSGSAGAEGTAAVTANPDPTVVVGPEVEQAAAEALDVPVSTLHGAEVEPLYDAATMTMTITATSTSAEFAADAANAYATAYVAQLPAVIDEQVAALDEQISALSSQIIAARDTLKARPNDPEATALQSTGEESLNVLTAQKTAYQTLVEPGQVTATAVADPVGLGRLSVLGIALLTGLAAGVGIAFVRRGLDTRVRTVEQAAEAADAPILAEVTGLRASLKTFAQTEVLPVASLAATPFTESVRELRTAVQVSLPRRDHAVVVVTAADPSAPRSFVAANLAVSWALSGRRTIVLSGDLRRPQIDELLPAPPTWEGTGRGLRPTTITNLELFPVPDQPLDSADYLATTAASDLVEALRAEADIVVVDAPPVLAAADATILGGYADGTVLLAAAGRTDRGVLGRAVDRLRTNDVALAGVALVGVASNHRDTYASTYGEEGDVRTPVTDVAGPDAGTDAERDVDTDPAASADVPAEPRHRTDAAAGPATEPDPRPRTADGSPAPAAEASLATVQIPRLALPDTGFPRRVDVIDPRPGGFRPVLVAQVGAPAPRPAAPADQTADPAPDDAPEQPEAGTAPDRETSGAGIAFFHRPAEPGIGAPKRATP